MGSGTGKSLSCYRVQFQWLTPLFFLNKVTIQIRVHSLLPRPFPSHTILFDFLCGIYHCLQWSCLVFGVFFNLLLSKYVLEGRKRKNKRREKGRKGRRKGGGRRKELYTVCRFWLIAIKFNRVPGKREITVYAAFLLSWRSLKSFLWLLSGNHLHYFMYIKQ